jgi:hypothetical protein
VCWSTYIRKKTVFKKKLAMEYGISQSSKNGKFVNDDVVYSAKRAAVALVVAQPKNSKGDKSSAHAKKNKTKEAIDDQSGGGETGDVVIHSTLVADGRSCCSDSDETTALKFKKPIKDQSGGDDVALHATTGPPGGSDSAEMCDVKNKKMPIKNGHSTGGGRAGGSVVGCYAIPLPRIRILVNKIVVALKERRSFLVDQNGALEVGDVDILLSSLSPLLQQLPASPPTQDNSGSGVSEEIAAATNATLRAKTVQDALRKFSEVDYKVPTEGYVSTGQRLVERMLAGLGSATAMTAQTSSSEAGSVEDVDASVLNMQRERCQKFVERWRSHFVEHTEPNFLPQGWSIKFQVEVNPLN